jgi:hypothetical protein
MTTKPITTKSPRSTMPTFTAEVTLVTAGQQIDLEPNDRVLVIGSEGGIGHTTRVRLIVLRATATDNSGAGNSPVKAPRTRAAEGRERT